MRTAFIVTLFLAAPVLSRAASSTPCPRFDPGAAIVAPPDLYSSHGALSVTLHYQSRVDSSGNTLYCFTTDNGVESPTLHVYPGDHLQIHLVNDLPPGTVLTMASMPGMAMTKSSSACSAGGMTSSATNLHFHGTNVLPVCHQDEVIQTTVDGGADFDYDVHFPSDEPPGLYWYHPHIHSLSEAAVLGGASGAIVVEGLENVNPAVAGLPQRVLLIRDNLLPANAPTGNTDAPAWDVSVNYVPVPYPNYTPAVLSMKPGERQLWRVVNASADTILDLQLTYDGVAQTLLFVGLDGVPVGSQDGTSRGKSTPAKHILLPPAGRAEFIVTGPSASVQSALLTTQAINTGPDGDNDPLRPLIAITADEAAATPAAMPAVSAAPPAARFASLAQAAPTATRHLYFSEVLSDPTDPNSPTNFYITVDGQTPVLFSPDNPPAIETTQGAVEDWTIENRALENHEFHIHQIHFLVLAKNGVAIPNGEFRDTIQVPYWSGTGAYPSVKLRMDFRGPTVGDFVYHCHILGHEDAGMMAIIRVKPRSSN